MKKYETEFKLEVVQSFLAGEGGAKLLARRLEVPEEKIRTWVSHYRLHGIDGLRPKRSTYSAQFKLQVLTHQDREQLSSRQVAAIYDIRNPNQVVVWRRNLDQGRLQALKSEEEERPQMKPKGNGFDNAVIESFFGTLKAEYFHLAAPNRIDALEAGVHDYVPYYNHERIKLGLQGLSPVEYRLRSTA